MLKVTLTRLYRSKVRNDFTKDYDISPVKKLQIQDDVKVD